MDIIVIGILFFCLMQIIKRKMVDGQEVATLTRNISPEMWRKGVHKKNGWEIDYSVSEESAEIISEETPKKRGRKPKDQDQQA